MTNEERRKKRKQNYSYLLVVAIFSVACFASSLFLDSDRSGSAMKATLPASGGEVGPLEVKRDNTVYQIVVSASMNQGYSNSWGFIEGELLDANKEFLMGFGEEMWREYYDGGVSQNDTFTLTFTAANRGIYYLNFASEYPAPEVVNSISIRISALKGNSHIHFVMGLIALVIVFFLRSKLNMEDDVDDSGGRKKSSSKSGSFGAVLDQIIRS